jgi:hypothetical protein
MTINDTTKYYPEIDKIIKSYNNTPHNSLNNIKPDDIIDNKDNYATINDINFDEFRNWLDPERVVVNVHCLYREFRGLKGAPDPLEMSAKMLRYRNVLKASNAYPLSACGHDHCDGQH